MQIRSLVSSDSTQTRSFSSRPSSNPESPCSSKSSLSSSSYFADAVLDSATVHENALLFATQRGALDVVETLLKQMSAEQLNRVHQRFHLNPLMVAIFENNMRLVQAFLNYPEIDLHKKSNYGDTALDLAVRARHIDIAFEILNHLRLPDACHKEKLLEFSDLILENVKKKIEIEYKILENRIDLCFDWLQIRQNIYEALQLYSQTGLQIRHDRCQIRRISDQYDQMILFGSHKGQECSNGAFKSIKPIQFFIYFNLERFVLRDVHLEVIVSSKSRLFSSSFSKFLVPNLEKQGFSKDIKISKNKDKPPRTFYKNTNLGMNLRSFVYGLEPDPYVLDESLRKEIVVCILRKFFLYLDKKKPLRDLKLNNMAIRIEEHEGKIQPIISFLDTVDLVITIHHIPLSFFKLNSGNLDTLLSNELLPFIQIVVACMTVILSRNAARETDDERASTVGILNEMITPYDERKKLLFKEALGFVLNPGRFCRSPHQGLTKEFLLSELADGAACKQKSSNSFFSL